MKSAWLSFKNVATVKETPCAKDFVKPSVRNSLPMNEHRPTSHHANLMKTISVAAIVCLMGWHCCRADQQNEGNSVSGDVHFVVRGTPDDRRIYLSGAGHPQDEVELCHTEGSGNLEMHFAPDDSSLVVQDGGSSLGVSLRLFQRDRGVSYKEITKADIDGKAERAALEQELLDHRYVKLLVWSADSKSFLFSLSGHGGDQKSQVRINRWLGIYDLASGNITFDLGKTNRAALEMSAK